MPVSHDDDRPHPRRGGQHATPWQLLPVQRGGRCTIGHDDFPAFELVVTVVRPWRSDEPSCWEAHLQEQATGLCMDRRDFGTRREAEEWVGYRVRACWALLAEYRRLVQRQVYARYLQDGKDADARVVLTARIEIAAKRLESFDQLDSDWWRDFEADLEAPPDSEPDDADEP